MPTVVLLTVEYVAVEVPIYDVDSLFAFDDLSPSKSSYVTGVVPTAGVLELYVNGCRYIAGCLLAYVNGF